MAFKSAFRTGSMPGLDFYPEPPSKPKGGSFLHNLLSDAIDTAKGIPFGMVELARNPVKSVKLMGQSYADTYGHGWGHFKTQFMAHPLQPLLDAISIPLILAGGAGIAVKGASSAANIGRNSALLAKSSRLAGQGRWAEADAVRAQAMPYPRLDAAAQRFRKGTSATTRVVEHPDLPGISLEKSYSSNLFRRALTKGSDAVLEGIVGKQVKHFSGPNLAERLLKKEKSKRAAATARAAKGQAGVQLAAKKAGLDPDEVVNRLGDQLKGSLVKNALLVDVAKAAELAKSPRFQKEFEFIYEEPAVPAHVTKARSDFTVDPQGNVTRTPNVGVPAQAADVATRRLTQKGYSNDQMLNAIQTLGEKVVTGGDPTRALVRNGKVHVVRQGLHEEMRHEVDKAAQLANLIYKAPQTAWKGFILGMSPRYFVNNVVGNAGMYAAATNPVEFTRGTLLAIRSVRGIRAEARAARDMGTTLDHLMARYMPDEWVHQRAGFLMHGALGLEQTVGMRLKPKIRRAAHARLYEVTEKVSYRGPQRAALMGALHSDADFRNLYRDNLQSGKFKRREDAYRDAADTIFSDRRKASAMEKRVTDWAGQYYHLNDLERKITAFVPFYTWDRHALRFGKEQVLSRPVSSVVLAQLGALGDEAADRELGKIPDFMKGAIPVKGRVGGVLGFLLGQNIEGRRKILLTAGYNPLAAAADNANAIAAMFGQGPRDPSESIGGQLNPIITGALAGVTGQRLFSGAKAETHGLGPLGGILQETFVELPHAKLIRQVGFGQQPKTTTSKGTPTLYEKGMRQVISSIMGLNERDFSPEAAERLYNEDHGIKKGRRKKKKDAFDAVQGLKSSLKSNF